MMTSFVRLRLSKSGSLAYGGFALAILVLGIAIRLVGLRRGIWLDEYFAIEAVLDKNFLWYIRLHDPHPPLYYGILKIWVQIRSSEWFLRLLSVAFGVTTLVVMMKWLRRYSERASLIVGLMCALSPILLRYSQEIREYPLLVLSTAVAMWGAARIVDQPHKRLHYLVMGIALSAAVLTHLIGAMVLATTGAFLFLLAINERQKINWKYTLAAFFVPATLFWIVYLFFIQRVPDKTTWWMPVVSFPLFQSTVYYVLGAPSLIWPTQVIGGSHPGLGKFLEAALNYASIGFVLILLFFGNWKRSWPLLAACVLYLIEIVAYSSLFTPIFFYRTILPAFIPFIGFISLQLDSISITRLRQAALAILICLCTFASVGWVSYEGLHPREYWRDLAQYLERARSSNDLVIFYPDYTEGPTRYYNHHLKEKNCFAFPLGGNLPELQAALEQRITSVPRDAIPKSIFLVLRKDMPVEKDSQTYQSLLAFLAGRYGQPKNSPDFNSISVSQYEVKAP